MTETKDLFEMLKDLCGCGYISDLRYEPYLIAYANDLPGIVFSFPAFRYGGIFVRT